MEQHNVGSYPEGAGEAQGSATSAAASRAQKKTKISREKVIYDVLAQGPRTRWELVDVLKWPYEKVNPRCSEMKARGILRPTGKTRPGHYGLQAEVLEVALPYSPKAAEKPKPSPAVPDSRFEIDLAKVEKLKTALAHLRLSMCGHAMKAETILNDFIKSV